MRGVVIFSAALMLVPVTLAADQESYRYVAGTAIDTELLSGAGTCTEEIVEPSLGGICGIAVAPGESLRVSVVDDVNGDIPFYVALYGEPAEPFALAACAPEIAGAGAVTIAIPEGCETVDVYVGAPGIVGTILIERL
jgi:hypothetical protein